MIYQSYIQSENLISNYFRNPIKIFTFINPIHSLIRLLKCKRFYHWNKFYVPYQTELDHLIKQYSF